MSIPDLCLVALYLFGYVCAYTKLATFLTIIISKIALLILLLIIQCIIMYLLPVLFMNDDIKYLK